MRHGVDKGRARDAVEMMSEPWLITGATDGVGLALARHCLSHGWEVVMVGRKALVELSEQIFTTESYCQADLSKPESAEKIVAFHQQGFAADPQFFTACLRGFFGRASCLVMHFPKFCPQFSTC